MGTTYSKGGIGYPDPEPPASYSSVGQKIYLRGFWAGIWRKDHLDPMEAARRRYTKRIWQLAFAEGYAEAWRRRAARGDQ